MVLTTVLLKGKHDSPAYSQVLHKILLSRETSDAWFGRPTDNPFCPTIKYPRYAWLELSRANEQGVLLRVNSHRARKKLHTALGKLRSYYSFERSCTGGFYYVTAEQAEIALTITGIKRAKDGADIHPCIDA